MEEKVLGTQNLSIKSWAEDDRPREKFLAKGRSSLSNAELIAMLIGSGTRNQSAVELAKIILQAANNDLNRLAQFTVKDFIKIKGVGEAKALTIAAALELGRRRNDFLPKEEPIFIVSSQIYNWMKQFMLDIPHEEFWVIYMARNGKHIKTEPISVGGVSATVVDAKIIFKKALNENATNLVLCHNHPSGNLNPSHEDILITRKLQNAASLLDITISDHIIFTNDGYYSLSENNDM